MKRGSIIGALLVIILAVAIFLTFFYYPKCSNLACWEEKLGKCSHAVYEKSVNNVDWKYKIKGSSGENCLVEAEIVKLSAGPIKNRILEDKSMTCVIPK